MQDLADGVVAGLKVAERVVTVRVGHGGGYHRTGIVFELYGPVGQPLSGAVVDLAAVDAEELSVDEVLIDLSCQSQIDI